MPTQPKKVHPHRNIGDQKLTKRKMPVALRNREVTGKIPTSFRRMAEYRGALVKKRQTWDEYDIAERNRRENPQDPATRQAHAVAKATAQDASRAYYAADRRVTGGVTRLQDVQLLDYELGPKHYHTGMVFDDMVQKDIDIFHPDPNALPVQDDLAMPAGGGEYDDNDDY